jgi:hypothetical protein
VKDLAKIYQNIAAVLGKELKIILTISLEWDLMLFGYLLTLAIREMITMDTAA